MFIPILASIPWRTFMVKVQLKGEILLNINYRSQKNYNVWYIEAAP